METTTPTTPVAPVAREGCPCQMCLRARILALQEENRRLREELLAAKAAQAVSHG